ncbi:MAG TPA: hypothetical protein VHB77_03525, partial [Planctomycetaceae bacterium]|nr:hypothetical protein [Planctomycetaceae bacterium]
MMPAAALFASNSMYREASRYMERSASWAQNWPLFVAVGAILLFWMGLYYWDKYRKLQDATIRSPQALFHHLCRIHSLSRAQRALLTNAAHELKADDIAMVFVDPGILGRHAVAAEADSEAYVQLQQQLFAPQ